MNFLLGLIFLGGGIYIASHTLERKEVSNVYSTTRTLGGAILIIIIGILMLLGKW